MVRALAGDSTITSRVPRPSGLVAAPEVLGGTLFYLTSGGGPDAHLVASPTPRPRRYHPGGMPVCSVMSGNSPAGRRCSRSRRLSITQRLNRRPYRGQLSLFIARVVPYP